MAIRPERLEWLRYGAVLIALGTLLWSMASWQSEAEANDAAIIKEQERHCHFIEEQRTLNSEQAVMHAELRAWMVGVDEKLGVLLERGD